MDKFFNSPPLDLQNEKLDVFIKKEVEKITEALTADFEKQTE